MRSTGIKLRIILYTFWHWLDNMWICWQLAMRYYHTPLTYSEVTILFLNLQGQNVLPLKCIQWSYQEIRLILCISYKYLASSRLKQQPAILANCITEQYASQSSSKAPQSCERKWSVTSSPKETNIICHYLLIINRSRNHWILISWHAVLLKSLDDPSASADVFNCRYVNENNRNWGWFFLMQPHKRLRRQRSFGMINGSVCLVRGL